MIVSAIDELLLLQRGTRARACKLGDDQFKQVVANIRKEQGLAGRREVPAGARAGGHDDGRSAEAAGAPDADRAGAAPGDRIEADRSPRKRRGSTTRSIPRSSPTRRRSRCARSSSTVPAVEAAASTSRKTTRRKKKIEDVRARALKGEDFAKLAAEVSDSPSKANGGLIGPFSRADMSPQLLALVDKMKQGDITQPIRTAEGLPDLQARNAEGRRRCSRSIRCAI